MWQELMVRKLIAVALFVGAIAGAGGCERSSPSVPVEGVVTRNGKPLSDVEIVFLADPGSKTVGPRATGRTDESGRYRLQLEGGGSGAVPGTHRVLVFDLKIRKPALGRGKGTSDTPPELAKRSEVDVKRNSRVPTNYSDINTTPLRATVGADPLVFDIELH